MMTKNQDNTTYGDSKRDMAEELSMEKTISDYAKVPIFFGMIIGNGRNGEMEYISPKDIGEQIKQV